MKAWICNLTLGLLGLVSALPLSAQVVTPYLDPTLAPRYAAASGWREGSVVGGAYMSRDGHRHQGAVQQYEFVGSQSEGTAVLKFDTSVLEAQVLQNNNTTKVYVASDQPVQSSLQKSQVDLSVIGGDFASLGLDYGVVETVTYYDLTTPSVKEKEERTTGSLSIRVGSALYVGGAYSRVGKKSGLYVDNNWSEVAAGVGLRTGSPGGSRFRMEVSVTQSPKTTKDSAEGKTAAGHPRTAINQASVEIMLAGLLFSGESIAKKEEVHLVDPTTSASIDSVTVEVNRGGVLWVPNEGLVMGFYFGSEKHTQLYVDAFSDFQVKLGYLF